VFFFIII